MAERLGDLPPSPVLRIINPALAGRIGQGQPAWPNHHQQHTASPQPSLQLLNEIHTRWNGPGVQEDPILAEPRRQLSIDQRCGGLAVRTAIVDEYSAQ